MKNKVNLAKILTSFLGLVTVISVTFFITATLVWAVDTWIGAPGAPPADNLPGYIWNTSGSGSSQPDAEINIGGKATIGNLEVTGSGNAVDVITGSVTAGSFCIPDSDPGCMTSWSDIAGGYWQFVDPNIYYNAGRVGIGTENPALAKLQVESNGEAIAGYFKTANKGEVFLGTNFFGAGIGVIGYGTVVGDSGGGGVVGSVQGLGDKMAGYLGYKQGGASGNQSAVLGSVGEGYDAWSGYFEGGKGVYIDQPVKLASVDTDASASLYNKDGVLYWDGQPVSDYPEDDDLWLKSGEDIYNDNTGNVGIGTQDPTANAKLSVISPGGDNQKAVYAEVQPGNETMAGQFAIGGPYGAQARLGYTPLHVNASYGVWGTGASAGVLGTGHRIGVYGHAGNQYGSIGVQGQTACHDYISSSDGSESWAIYAKANGYGDVGLYADGKGEGGYAIIGKGWNDWSADPDFCSQLPIDECVDCSGSWDDGGPSWAGWFSGGHGLYADKITVGDKITVNTEGTGITVSGGTFGISAEGRGAGGKFTNSSSGDLAYLALSFFGVNYAGFFDGNVHIAGDLTVTGLKPFIQDHPTDSTKQIRFIALEGDESGTYTRGSSQLRNGQAVIDLPEHFSLVTAENGITVQITPTSDTNGLYVASKNNKQVVVKEVKNGQGNSAFDYLVQGIRKGYENLPVIIDKHPEKIESDQLGVIENSQDLKARVEKAEAKFAAAEKGSIQFQGLDSTGGQQPELGNLGQPTGPTETEPSLKWWQKIGNFFKNLFK